MRIYGDIGAGAYYNYLRVKAKRNIHIQYIQFQTVSV